VYSATFTQLATSLWVKNLFLDSLSEAAVSAA